MNNETNFSIACQQIEQMKKIADVLMSTKHYQKMGYEGIFAILAKAKSLNMDPIDALNGGLYCVQGKVGMSTETMAARIRTAGHSVVQDQTSTPDCVVLLGKRADSGDTWTTRFSIDDAKRAGLFRGIWEKYPTTMCYNRAMSLMFRQLFPDLSQGAGYTYDELREISDSKTIDVSQDIPEIGNTPIQQISHYIDEEQVRALEDLVKDDQTLKLEFLKLGKISDFKELEAKRYEGALSYIKKLKENRAPKKEETKDENDFWS